MRLEIEGNVDGFRFVLKDMPETTTELLTLIGYLERVKQVIMKKIMEETDNFEVSMDKGKEND